VKRYSKRDIIREINNDNREILVYLSRKYFPSVRRLLRVRGFHDELTPGIFSDVLAAAYLKLQQQHNEYIDFEQFLIRMLNDHIKELKERNVPEESHADQSVDIASHCVSIMEEQSQQLLFCRIAAKRSYEHIKEKFQFSNAVIAQYEVNKAFNQLEGIVKLRLNF